jgi:hypothetical protein
MNEFLSALQAKKQKILATLDPETLATLNHIDALILSETTGPQSPPSGNQGGDTPPVPPEVG